MAEKKNAPQKKRKKRGGVKFVLTLLILLGAGGAAFWFGLLSLELEEGEYGVVYTKLNGYEPQALSNGEFAWRWEALIPTNLTLKTFRLETRSVELKASGSLPSGPYYAALAGDGMDFDWNVTARIRYRLDPDALPPLVADGLVGSGLDDLYAEYESLVEREMGRVIREEAGGSSDTPPMDRLRAVEMALASGVSGLDERMEIIEVSVLDWEFPDLVLYEEVRSLALDLLSRRRDVLAEVEDAALRRTDAQDSKIGLLDRYGEVLDRYPILLDLFSLEGNPGASLLPEASPEVD